MDKWILFELVVIIHITQVPTEAQVSCPESADVCVQRAGITSGIADTYTFCTETPSKVIDASSCLQSCNYPITSLYQETIDGLTSTCSSKTGCENYLKGYEAFRFCYNTTDELKRLTNVVITRYNARVLLMDDCLNLRAVRSCMKNACKGCVYLEDIYTELSQNVDKFEIALVICGAENVVTKSRTEGCDSALNNMEANCNIACDLAAATSAGDICTQLQKQSDCIYEFSQDCTEVQLTQLQPRMSSYSIINQLFHCNITIGGVAVLPSYGLQCDYKEVLKKCFNIKISDGIPLLTVRKLLNGDAEDVCSLNENREELVSSCLKVQWSCLVPLTQMYARKPSESEFNSRLGTFPLNDLGLKLILNGCSSGQPKSTWACTSPSYDATKWTPQRTLKYTSGMRQTPHPLKN